MLDNDPTQTWARHICFAFSCLVWQLSIVFHLVQHSEGGLMHKEPQRRIRRQSGFRVFLLQTLQGWKRMCTIRNISVHAGFPKSEVRPGCIVTFPNLAREADKLRICFWHGYRYKRTTTWIQIWPRNPDLRAMKRLSKSPGCNRKYAGYSPVTPAICSSPKLHIAALTRLWNHF